MGGAYFCMGVYKFYVVVVIKIGAYIHRCLCCVGAYYTNFTWFMQLQESIASL